jgi:UPF0716 family protein affecting phage T7 exclusion
MTDPTNSPMSGDGVQAALARPSAVRAFTSALVLIAGVLFLFPVLDLAASTLPLRAGEVQWRFGAVGLFSGLLLTPVLAALLLLAAAILAGRRVPQRILAWSCTAFAAALVVVAAGFLLDFLQMHATLRPEMRSAMQRAMLVAVAKLGLTTLSFGWVAFAAFRISRRRRIKVRREPEGERPMLVGTGSQE